MIDQTITAEKIIGKGVVAIYQTEPFNEEGFLGTPAQHFHIVLELSDHTYIEIGAYELKAWNKKSSLKLIEGTSWSLQLGLEYKGRYVKKIIERDRNEFHDGSLTLILDNDVILEHHTTNGDQLFIGTVEE